MKQITQLIFTTVLAACFWNIARAVSPSQYIAEYKGCAIEQMLIYNIPASITLAQGMLESKCGSSPLAVYANNHFGIKCHDDWSGDYYIYDDDKKGEHFRKYQNADESYHDHAEFLKSRPWYTFLFKYPRTDYTDWAKGLEKAGYATDKDYASQLLEIIIDYQLFVYDTVLQNLHGYGILYNVHSAYGATEATGQDFVIVKHGDCIFKIAREYNIDAQAVCRYNGITLNAILMPGMKIYLTNKANVNHAGVNNSQNHRNMAQETSTVSNGRGSETFLPLRNADYQEKKAE